MRRQPRLAVLLALVSSLVVCPWLLPPAAGAVAAAAETRSFTADLTTGEPAGVTVQAGVVQLAPDAPAGPADAGTPAPANRTGLLTLPPRQLDIAVAHVTPQLVAEQPPGTFAAVDVRGRRSAGDWSEWIPAPAGGSASLPEPSVDIQLRVVLGGPSLLGPTVRGLQVSVAAVDRSLLAAKPAVPVTYRVFATREGLVGGTTANGHVITENDHFVALPSRRALSPKDKEDYTVKVCAANGRCAWAPVWDVGPWNIRDDYWNVPSVRQEWTQLPQGIPQAHAAYRQGFNAGLDGFGRKVANPAGIDLADGVFRSALQLTDNAYVTASYLWTGRGLLRKVQLDRAAAEVRSAPRPDAPVVGMVANRAAVAVECGTPGPGGPADARWLRIGPTQYVPAATVPTAATPAAAADAVRPCPAGA